jgi:hypothetical protein
MSLTLLALVSAVNDATMLLQAATPLIESARAAGKGDDHVFTDAELDAHALAVGANVQSLRDLAAKQENQA